MPVIAGGEGYYGETAVAPVVETESYGPAYVGEEVSTYAPGYVREKVTAYAPQMVAAVAERLPVAQAVKTKTVMVKTEVLQKGQPVCGLNPLRTCNEEQLAAQRAYFESAFEGQPWGWWFENYFPFFIRVFPFLFFAEFSYYPPLYYDFFECSGNYPQPIERFEQYRTGALPWPKVG